MRKKMHILILLALTLMLLAGCGGDGDDVDTEVSTGEGDLVALGDELYHQTTIGAASAPGCITCHNVEPTGDPLQPSPVGPSHYGVGNRAGEYVAGMSAEDYLHESIVAPDDHIVEGFPAGVMYQNYEEDLTEEQIDALVAYLLTLDAE